MRVLISGGLGFIGGRLAKYLLNAGHQIVIGSRKISNPPYWLTQAEVVEINWSDDTSLEKICIGIDVVIHAAGINAQDCALDPIAALEFNGLATTRLLEASCKAGVGRFINLSSAHVYSNPLVGEITEETEPRNPHPYATSRLVGDYAVLNAQKLGKIQGVVVRLSNGFGAPMHKDVNCWMLLVNDLCKQAVLTQKIILKSNGIQERDFIGVHQVCKTLELLAFNNNETPQTGVFNLGSGMAQSVISMAELIQQRCFRVLGFMPTLSFPNTDEDLNILKLKLSYRINKLKALGVKFINEEKVKEIDELLFFCESEFGR